jgi:hypothetical protein
MKEASYSHWGLFFEADEAEYFEKERFGDIDVVELREIGWSGLGMLEGLI